MSYVPVAERKEQEAAAKADQQKLMDDATRAHMAKNRILWFNKGLPRRADFPEIRDPNPLQKKLIDAWENPAYKVFTYSGGNRLGKCLTYDTLVDTPKGEVSVGSLFETGKPFEVYAWNGKEKVVAKAEAPFKKEGLHKCFEIKMSDGRIIQAADHHRILTTHGWLSVVETYESFQRLSSPCSPSLSQPSLGQSSSGLSPLNLLRDVQHLFETPSDYQGDYSDYCRQCDGQPPIVPVTGLTLFLRSGGVLPPCVASYNSDVQARTSTNSPLLESGHLSNQYVPHQNEGRCAASLPHAPCNTSPLHSCLCQEVPQSQTELAFPPPPSEVSDQQLHLESDCNDSTIYSPFVSPLYIDGNQIESITSIPAYQEVYDFEVETYHNYFAGGLIHHNTTSGAIIAIATVAGEWPWSGKKLNFMHDKPRKVRYVGQGWEQHVKAVVEPALRFWWPEAYKLVTKKNNQGIDATWQLINRSHHGERILGTIEIMSNVQDSAVFEGWEGDLIIYDEPPRRDVRVACARGLVDREGRELFCMTLLGEAWIHREVIKAKLPDGTPDMSVFNINGESSDNVGYGITQAGLDQFAKTLKPEEVEARIKGKPSYLSSLLCPRFDIHLHVKERFTVPLDALIDISIDWHPSKPLAVVFLATLRPGVKYVVDEIKFRGPTKSAAEEIIRVIRQRDYARINRIVIDPLSKSGAPNDTDAYTIFSEVFSAYGYCLDVASKDKENGIEILNGLLWTENQTPALFFFKDCISTIQEVEDMMYDPDTFKPVKVNDDYFECLYRLCLMDTQWFPAYESKSSGSCNVVL